MDEILIHFDGSVPHFEDFSHDIEVILTTLPEENEVFVKNKELLNDCRFAASLMSKKIFSIEKTATKPLLFYGKTPFFNFSLHKIINTLKTVDLSKHFFSFYEELPHSNMPNANFFNNIILLFKKQMKFYEYIQNYGETKELDTLKLVSENIDQTEKNQAALKIFRQMMLTYNMPMKVMLNVFEKAEYHALKHSNIIRIEEELEKFPTTLVYSPFSLYPAKPSAFANLVLSKNILPLRS